MTRVWKLLTSVKLAAVLGGAILAAALVATLLKPAMAYAAVYRAKWFLVLLAAFGVNLVACAIHRARFLRWATLGSFVSHVGALTILAGAAVGAFWGKEGGIAGADLREGKPVDRFTSDDGKTTYPLPFQLRLEKFSLDLYPPRLWILQEGPGVAARMESFVVKKGTTLSTDRGEVTFTVEDVFENHQLQEEVVERSDENIGPGVLVKVNDSDGTPVFEGWLVAEEKKETVIQTPHREGHGDDHNHTFKVAYLGLDPDLSDTLWGPETPRLFVRLRDQKIVRSMPPRAGQVMGLSDGTVVAVNLATLDYSKRDKPDADLAPVNPAVQVAISGSQGDEERWVFGKYPEYGLNHAPLYKNVSVVYRFPEDPTPVLARIRTVLDGMEIRHALRGSGGTIVDLTPGQSVPVNRDGVSLTLERYSPHAALTRKEVDAGGGLLNPALRVHIRGAGRDESVTLKNGESFCVAPGEVNIAYGYQEGHEGDIRNFDSAVKVLEGEKVVAAQTVSVNHPLVHRGYRLYQNAYKPRTGNEWTPAFRVVKDPGLPLIYVGFAILSAGLLFASFGRPWLKGRSA
ncbi:MAG: cytochrome c biogenesis protein ResB [Planctomycetes bacterium]|nr:cytochrome c biogenesis protein ResB [Planctomycetota bacterium]